jgi:uncharacterized protein YqeY
VLDCSSHRRKRGAKMKVVHCKDKHDVYIGRPSKWGNPFEIGKDGTREEVIQKYHDWVLTQPHLVCSLHELSGKTLGCWCKPKPCHGDALIQLINLTTIHNLLKPVTMKDKLQNLINEARKNKDNDARIALQTVTSVIQDTEYNQTKPVTDAEIFVFIKKELAKFNESINGVKMPDGSIKHVITEDQKTIFQHQADTLSALLPQAVDESKYEDIAKDYIKESGATSMRDMGKVLPKIAKDFGIKVDMGKMSPIVRNLLNQQTK